MTNLTAQEKRLADYILAEIRKMVHEEVEKLQSPQAGHAGSEKKRFGRPIS